MAGKDDYSRTAASNSSLASGAISVAEGMAPGDVNNAIRQLMADLANRPSVTIASASTTNVLGADSEVVNISGTTTITSFGTGVNRIRFVRFTGSLTLTNSATLILPGGANIVTSSGDWLIAVSDSSSGVAVVGYFPTGGAPLVATQAQQEAASSVTSIVTPGRQKYHPSAAKFWGHVTTAAFTIEASYNISGVIDNGNGDFSATIDTNFSGDWCGLCSVLSSGSGHYVFLSGQDGTTMVMACRNQAGTASDPVAYFFAGFGDQ